MQTFVTNVCIGEGYACCVALSFFFGKVSVYLGRINLKNKVHEKNCHWMYHPRHDLLL